MKNKLVIYFLSGAVIVILVFMLLIYRSLFGITIKAPADNKAILIPTGSSYEQVLDSLYSNLNIKNHKIFEWVAKKKHYPALIKPGRYVLDFDISRTGLIDMLRSGRQRPVNITFINVRTLNELAGRIGSLIEADSLMMINFLSDESNYRSDGFNKQNIIALFIPNTYELYWNTNAKGVYMRMLKEYNLFWNSERLAKAKNEGLDPKDVATLASIVDAEASKPDEKPRIAGVYLNRIRRGIPLQSDPTIKFALNDFSITRVLKKNLDIDSPYNTYKHSGFPPGPIACPSVNGLDAVLNAEKNEYMYFVAKSDFSGYHNFSKTLGEHNRYAAMYQRELNKRKIFK